MNLPKLATRIHGQLSHRELKNNATPKPATKFIFAVYCEHHVIIPAKVDAPSDCAATKRGRLPYLPTKTHQNSSATTMLVFGCIVMLGSERQM